MFVLTASAHSPASPQDKTLTPAESFKKGIKRDSTMFNSFKEGKQCDAFRRHLKAAAMTQDEAEVLDVTCTPNTEEEKDLYEEKHKFMCLVFKRTLQTDQGEALMRLHESAYDLQSSYAELSEHCEKNDKAALDSSVLLACITTARVDERKGSSKSFILNWQEKVRQYELLAKNEDKFSNAIKLTMLQNAVSPLECLKRAKDIAE